MEGRKIKLCILIALLFCFSKGSYAQLTGFIKSGINIGTINEEWWVFANDSVRYGKPLIRPILGIGAQLQIPQKWMFRQEVMFQIKGQGTATPDVRTFFRTSNPDILRFMSFPFTVHRRIVSDFWLGVGFQPSIYLSGKDNYQSKDNWRGWLFSSNANVQYVFNKTIEIGFEYDYDFPFNDCIFCYLSFNTYRFYGIYHFPDK